MNEATEKSEENVTVPRSLLAALQEAAQRNAGSHARLAAAYTKAWAELGIGVEKDASNPHFGNDYATLAATLGVLKPVFARHGLALLQCPGKMEGDRVSVAGILFHESGELLMFDTQLPIGGKSTAQAAGSAFTYGRRYQAQAVAGITAVDDDGEAASDGGPKHPGRKRAEQEAKEELSGYSAKADALIAEIEAFDGGVAELDAQLRPAVVDMADERINAAFVAKKSELKKQSKGKK